MRENGMSVCSNCYKSQISIKHDVGHWWNNPPDHVYVCSDKCKEEIEKKVADGTWMIMRPFPKTESDDGLPKAITDKQFGT